MLNRYLNVGTKIDFTVGCIVNSFDLSPENLRSEPKKRSKELIMHSTVKSVLVPTFSCTLRVLRQVQKLYLWLLSLSWCDGELSCCKTTFSCPAVPTNGFSIIAWFKLIICWHHWTVTIILTSFRSSWYMIRILSHQMHSIIFFPKLSGVKQSVNSGLIWTPRIR